MPPILIVKSHGLCPFVDRRHALTSPTTPRARSKGSVGSRYDTPESYLFSHL